jgi:hypothetical protein
VNLLVSLFLILGAVGHFVISQSVSSIIIGTYSVLASLIVLASEIRQYPKGLETSFPGWWSFLGRGMFYLLFGVLNLEGRTILEVAGAAVAFTGIVYIILAWVPAARFPG